MKKEHTLSAKEINENIDSHIDEISKEFREGFTFLKKYPKSVSMFGSSHSSLDNPHYEEARKLATRIVTELGYAVITGGGPGIMEGANLGAKEGGGHSVGLTIILPQEQHINPYTTASKKFNYFFTRKTMLTFAAEAYVFYPGGFGTFDELFSIITLVQTAKIPKVPIILVGKDFWNTFKEFMIKNMLEKHHSIDNNDLNLFVITDNENKILEIIKNAPVSKWWEMAD